MRLNVIAMSLLVFLSLLVYVSAQVGVSGAPEANSTVYDNESVGECPALCMATVRQHCSYALIRIPYCRIL